MLRVGRAVDSAGSYRLDATQQNFVLDRWGGSDGGTMQVDIHGDAAVADLHRTGDGQYAIVLQGGETYFKRETCPTWARIQAGREVLAPFVISGAEFRGSKVVETLPPSSATSTRAKVDLAGVGEVTLEVDTETGRPLRITSDTLTNNGKPLEWSFSAWGEKVSVPNTATDRLSGPGGNPC